MTSLESWKIELNYNHGGKSITKSLSWYGNDNVIIGQESDAEEVKIRLPLNVLRKFIEMVEC